MQVAPIYVNTIEEFISRVRVLHDKWDQRELWFRGVPSSRLTLRPSLYREPRPTSEPLARRREDEARIEFSRRSRALAPDRNPIDDLEWYILMRHHEVPTRLLDWTEAALVALYFAVRISNHENSSAPSNAAVWVLDPQWLNKTVTGKSNFVIPTDPAIQRYLPPPRARKKMGLPPLAILPPYLITQMYTQRSVFTIHGAPHGFGSIRGKLRLVKLVIRHSGLEQIQDDLDSCGVNEATVFPTLSGLGREVTEHFL